MAKRDWSWRYAIKRAKEIFSDVLPLRVAPRP